jgi:plastocyanin
MKKNLLLSFVCAFAISLQMNATVHIVSQVGFLFEPASFNLVVGDTVRFVRTSGTHNTVSTSVPEGAATWNSPLSSSVTEFDYEVQVAGEYSYECTLHSGQIGSFTAEVAPNSVQNVSRAAIDMNVHTSASGNLTVRVLNASGDKATVTMLDITGREVATLHQGVIASDDFTIRQDVSVFQRGIYFVRFQQGARVSTRKVLVQ